MIYDKASLVQIPSGVKSGTLYNVLPNTADGDFDFTRGSTATRVNQNGLIETVASGVPRLDYPLLDGVVQDCPALLLEPSRMNSQPYSEDLTQTSRYGYGAITVTSNAIVSPDGSQTADKIVETASNARHELYGNLINYSGTSSISFFAKAAERQFISVFIGGDPTVGGATFDVLNGLIILTSGGTNANIEDFGNGWFRCSFTSTKVANSNVYYCLRTNGNAVNIETYQGDGTSGMYIWGIQSEVSSSYPTSYIPTLIDAAVTRSADVCNNAQADFNDSEGVLFAEISALADDGTVRSIAISGSITNDVVRFYYDGVSNGITAFVYNGAYQSVFTTIVNDITENNKIAFSYKLNEFKLFINGLQVGVTDTNGTTPNGLDKLKFDNGYGGEDFYGKSKQVMTFNEALSDTELENLTSWNSFREMATGQLYTIK